MKHVDKKLLSIAIVGLSAWALVIALVFNGTTTAMLTTAPTPPEEQAQATSSETQPRTLGATTEATALDAGEVQGASITQASPSNFVTTGNQDLSGELETNTSARPSKLWIPVAIISGVFLLVGAVLWFLASQQKPDPNQ